MTTHRPSSCHVLVIENNEDDEHAPFAGSRELLNNCTHLIAEYLQWIAHESTPRDSEMSTWNCLQYFSGRTAMIRDANGKRRAVDPSPSTPRLHPDAFAFLSEWIVDEDEGSEEGEPWCARYTASRAPHIRWVQSFTRIRIPIGDKHVLILRPHQRAAPMLYIHEHLAENDADADNNSVHALMTVCERGTATDMWKSPTGVDMKEHTSGHVDFVVHMLTARQFDQQRESHPAIPPGVSHVLTVMFGNTTFHALISPAMHRKTSHLWRSLFKVYYYLFDPSFLISQFFIEP